MTYILSTNASTYDNERTICATLTNDELVELKEAARFALPGYANEAGFFAAQVQPAYVLRLAIEDEQAARSGNLEDIIGLGDYAVRMADQVEVDAAQDALWAD